jgi:argininosuccinate synthase
VPAEKAPDQAEIVEVEFEAGNPISVNGKKLAAHEIIAELNKIGGRHGVGVTVLAENRLVGMKSRGVYETPGGTILYEAHKALEQICIERETLHFKQQVSLRYAELVYYGQWFHPLRESLQAFVDHTNATVSGIAKVRLFKGRAMQVGAKSPNTLYDPQLASFSMEGYDVTAARGFIDLFGLPMKVAQQRKRW